MKELIKFELFKLRKNSIIMLIFVATIFMFLLEIPFAKMQIEQEAKEHKIATTNLEVQELQINEMFDNSRIVITGQIGGGYQTAVILIVIALSCVAVGSEYAKKTIKLLYIRPYKRVKHYISKFCAVFAIVMLLAFILLAVIYVVFAIMYKGQLLLPMAGQMIGALLFTIPDILIWESISFLIIHIVTNTPIAMLIGIVLFMIMGQVDFNMEDINNLPIIQYTFLNYWHFPRFIFDSDYIVSVFDRSLLDYNVIKSLVVCTIYFVLFTYLGIRVAKKKDIKNQV